MEKRVSEDWQFFNAAVMFRSISRLAAYGEEAAVAVAKTMAPGEQPSTDPAPAAAAPQAGLAGASPASGTATSPARSVALAVSRHRVPTVLLALCLLVLTVLCIALLAKPTGVPAVATAAALPPAAAMPPATAPPVPGGGPGILPAPSVDGLSGTTVYATLHRAAYRSGQVVTTWFFAEQQGRQPLSQVCAFYLEGDAGEALRNFEIGDATGRRKPHPGYIATRMTLSEWVHAADFCQWYRVPEAPPVARPGGPAFRRT